MIEAIVKKEVESRSPNDPRGVIEVRKVYFHTIGEIEDYLCYHRAYIRGIQFKGKIEEKDED